MNWHNLVDKAKDLVDDAKDYSENASNQEHKQVAKVSSSFGNVNRTKQTAPPIKKIDGQDLEPSVAAEVTEETTSNDQQQSLIQAMKPGALMPDAILDEFEQLANERSGLVRKVDLGNQHFGYSAIILLEPDLLKMGFRIGKADLGMLAGQMDANTVKSATMMQNIAHNELAFIPDEKTLLRLKADYPEILNYKAGFHWAYYSANNDTQDFENARTICLKNRISLKVLLAKMYDDVDLRYDQQTQSIQPFAKPSHSPELDNDEN